MTRGSRSVHPLHPGLGALAVSVGGALGAVARWGLTTAFPVAAGHFPWPTLIINVAGSGLLAALPLLPVARRHAWVGLLVGTGILGGFTTMSAASVDTFTLLREDETMLALVYCVGTLAAALAVVLVVERLTTPAERDMAEDAGWDE